MLMVIISILQVLLVVAISLAVRADEKSRRAEFSAWMGRPKKIVADKVVKQVSKHAYTQF